MSGRNPPTIGHERLTGLILKAAWRLCLASKKFLPFWKRPILDVAAVPTSPVNPPSWIAIDVLLGCVSVPEDALCVHGALVQNDARDPALRIFCCLRLCCSKRTPVGRCSSRHHMCRFGTLVRDVHRACMAEVIYRNPQTVTSASSGLRSRSRLSPLHPVAADFPASS